MSHSGITKRTTMDVDSYVLLNRRILSLVGLHPKNSPRSFTVVFLMFLIVVPQVTQIYHSEDLSVVLETSSVLLTIILALLKMTVWCARRDEINDLISFMFGDYWNMIDFGGMGASTFLRYARFAKTFTKCYVFLVANALLLFCGLPVVYGSVNKTRTLSFPGMYPDGWTAESPFYEIVFLSQVLATCTCGAVLLAIDTLIATALFHTCGHFKIVQQDLRGIGDDVDEILTTRDGSREVFARRKLSSCVKHHQVVLRFSETMDRLFNPIMLCQVLASNMIICLVGLQVTSTLTDRGKGLKYFSYLLMALFQLILFCLPGEDLVNQSLAVSDVAYATNWYKVSKLLKADVRFIIARGQKPATITAGKFTVMCLEHFGAVLSTAMSYFTVLRSFN